MVFSSYTFIFCFLPLFLLCYFCLPRRGRMLVLTVFSYVFYAWWDWRFAPLLLFSTTVDYVCGRYLVRVKSRSSRKSLLVVSIATNLSLLGFFKYFMFIAKTGSDIFAALGVPFPSELLLVKVILPVGISFYTFQGLSYTIDIYRGIARPTRSFLDFACYIVMFPQLIAGPIVRYTHMENQLRVPCFSYARIYAGIQFFILGLAKKVLLADTASLIADGVFASTAGQLNDLSSLDALLGGLAYTLQIYFDFSGYSDMAVGLGYFCGYEFPQNFNSPYKSKSITEFWRRWHITLSTWMRDYVYIPLGGSRRGWGRTYVNLVVTFLLCGFWHGANWTFVLWGAFHGALLMSDRLTAGWSVLRRVPAVLRVAVTFVLVSIGWYIFRAPSVGVAMGLLGSLFNGDFVMREIIRIENWKVGLAAMACGMGIVFGCRNSWEISKDVSVAKTMALLLLLFLSVVFLFGNVSHPFLYFQF